VTINLMTFFPSLQFLSEYPTELNEDDYTFHNPQSNTWISIRKTEVTKREHALLSSIYTEIKSRTAVNDLTSTKWLNFLESAGPSPLNEEESVRIIQLYFKENNINEADITEACQAFFGDSMQLLFISSQCAYLIEKQSTYLCTVEDFSSFIAALESDFYSKARLYIGKFQPVNSHFPQHFSTEKNWFLNSMERHRAERIYTMENSFPFHLIQEMSEDMKHVLVKEILVPIDYDLELLQTVQLFFENGFNASITAKKLHIHRNTLQYRLAKFHNITGIPVRQFDGALVAYCASLIAEKH
jgi:sugar diacid utilization regulator